MDPNRRVSGASDQVRASTARGRRARSGSTSASAYPSRRASADGRLGLVRAQAPRHRRRAGPATSRLCVSTASTSARPGVPSLAGPATSAHAARHGPRGRGPPTRPRSRRAGWTRPATPRCTDGPGATRASCPPRARRSADRAVVRRPYAREVGRGHFQRAGTRLGGPDLAHRRQGPSSAASDSAMAPLPVPASTTTRSCAPGVAREAQTPASAVRDLHHLLGLGARDQHPRVDEEVERAEGPVAEDVLQRLPRRPPRRPWPRRRHGVVVERARRRAGMAEGQPEAECLVDDEARLVRGAHDARPARRRARRASRPAARLTARRRRRRPRAGGRACRPSARR